MISEGAEQKVTMNIDKFTDYITMANSKKLNNCIDRTIHQNMFERILVAPFIK